MSWNSFVSSGGVRSWHFETHDKAIAHFNAVKPIRGRTPELKPLGSNRTYIQCKVTHDPLVDSVSAVLYETPCVTIFPDNTIKLNRGGWVTPSTANFIDAVLPSKFGSVRIQRRRIIYTTRGTKQEYVIPEKGLWLQISEDGESAEPILDNAPTLYEYKADRKVLNAIRKNIKPFLDAARVMTSMSETYDVQEVAELYPNVIDDYVRQVNDHNDKMRRKEAGDPDYENYYGYFYGTYAFRNAVAKRGAPRLATLSGIGDSVKRTPDTSRHTHSPFGTAEYKDGYNIEEYVTLVSNLFSDNAETVRKVMLQVATNSSNYAREVRNGAELAIDTLFGKVNIPHLEWEMSGSALENYVIDVIKYVYADLIFKKVEVPQGVLPSTQNEKYVLCNKYLVEQEDIITRRYVVL